MNCCEKNNAVMTCAQGRACPVRTRNGGQRIDTANRTADELPVVMIEPPSVGSALKWFAVAVFAASFAAWLGLAAGYWGMK